MKITREWGSTAALMGNKTAIYMFLGTGADMSIIYQTDSLDSQLKRHLVLSCGPLLEEQFLAFCMRAVGHI